MNGTNRPPDGRSLRLLVAIASFGDKNLDFLKRIIRDYRNMSMEVDVVVVSNAPKNLGPDVRVVVGLPSKNPWSLPFAHKPIFAENANAYDLFIYSEDDMAVTEANIRAFLQLTPQLETDEIAGYLRYEVNQAGEWSLPEAHGMHRWKPESVRKRGPHTIAEFSNDHAAFYLLTRPQLKRAIESGGFLREPYEGRYDMLCTAATDPYTHCGFRKVICITALDDFLIHHLPNRYTGQLGLPLASMREQVQALLQISDNGHPASMLCNVESKLEHGKWSKSFDEQPLSEAIDMIPPEAKTILSVGCGLGITEIKLKERGVAVTAFPLDSVMGAITTRCGIEVVYGRLDDCFNKLGSRLFDCVLMTNLLHLQPDPNKVLAQCSRVVGEGGVLVMSGPNFHSIPVRAKRVLGKRDLWKLRSYDESGIHGLAPTEIARRLNRAGLNSVETRWFNRAKSQKKSLLQWFPLHLAADSWVIRARR